ncbi:hypothetical protein DFH07DRAFT_956288 [Mycena maculata]|uniref:DUF6534 domain-containing protein n=1 Tax=Mycena maculata TaxID=230809 RepID=A0AAD7JFR9_9AGAR|nr:hypothetical protein DFH07DRAFT_956288 [Mycena maculata]
MSAVIQFFTIRTDGNDMPLEQKIILFVHETHSQELRPACRIAWNTGKINKQNFDVASKGHAAMEVKTFFLLFLLRSLSDLSDSLTTADTINFIYLVRYGSSVGADVYHDSCQDDQATINLLVYGLVLVDVLQTVMVTADGFHYPPRPLLIHMATVSELVGVYNCCIYFLRKGVVIPAAVFLVVQPVFLRFSVLNKISRQVSLTQFSASAGIYTGIRGHQMGHVSLLTKNAVGETIWLVGGAVASIAIATVLSWTLLRERSYSLPSNHCMISRLIRLIVEINALTAAVAMIAVILFWAYPEDEAQRLLPPLVLHFSDEIYDAAPDRAPRSSETKLNLAQISIIVKSGEEKGVTKPRVLAGRQL